MKLGDIAEVIIGILVSRERTLNGEYEYSLFSFKSCNNDEKANNITTNRNLDKQLTCEGDILFQLTYPNKIIYVDKNLENLLITSQICIIRPKKEIIDSIYLKWYLCSEKCSEQIALNITGSSIKKISVSDLRNTKIPCIELDKQRKIRDLIKLWDDEKKIMETIIQKKDLLYKKIIEDIINDALEGE